MRQKHHIEPPTEKKKNQNQGYMLQNSEKVDSFHKKLDEIQHPITEELGITVQPSTSETWSSPPVKDICLGDELNIQLMSPPMENTPTIHLHLVHTAAFFGQVISRKRFQWYSKHMSIRKDEHKSMFIY